ncbi:unnamed protein product [Meganyctiphanes norvegica]|uniref:UPAR/Ly6 domain-containing protein n=1 Tax=Meganyctiphanes norvegica TaxID=48144 RepID=A0AAV2RAV7_MEGNR
MLIFRCMLAVIVIAMMYMVSPAVGLECKQMQCKELMNQWQCEQSSNITCEHGIDSKCYNLEIRSKVTYLPYNGRTYGCIHNNMCASTNNTDLSQALGVDLPYYLVTAGDLSVHCCSTDLCNSANALPVAPLLTLVVGATIAVWMS